MPIASAIIEAMIRNPRVQVRDGFKPFRRELEQRDPVRQRNQ